MFLYSAVRSRFAHSHILAGSDKKQRAGEPYYSNGAIWRPYAVGCGFVLLVAGAFLAVGLLTLLAGCTCFWSFLADTLADAGFSCAVLA